MPTQPRKKLIEIALPLEVINEEGSRRKRKAPAGYPTTLHKWWAQRPVAAARAILFAQMVDDPSEYVETILSVSETRRAAERVLKDRRKDWIARKEAHAAAQASQGVQLPQPGPEPTLFECAADIERQRLFRIVEELVKWENTNKENVLAKAQAEIWQSWRRTCAANADHQQAKDLFNREKLPAFLDPFAGSGAIPLEAQRLGLETFASDLNPVAVLINKAAIEIPSAFAGQSPVHSDRDTHRHWKGLQGLADDVRYYGKWIRDESQKRIGHLYPAIEVTADMASKRSDLRPLVGQKLNVVAWIWVRTVKSPNPAFKNVSVPLASTFMLSAKKGRETYVVPVIDGKQYRFSVNVGKPKSSTATKAGTKISRGANFTCLLSNTPITGDYIKSEAQAGRLGMALMAIVVDGPQGRIFLPPTQQQESVARQAKAHWRPDVPISGTTQYLGIKPYGMLSFDQLFTERQLLAAITISDLILEARSKVIEAARERFGDAKAAGDHTSRYADAVVTYLAFAASRLIDYGSTLATWRPKDNAMRSSTPKQALQMTWDFAEGSPFGESSAGFVACSEVVAKVIETALPGGKGRAFQEGAEGAQFDQMRASVVCTDPPYYDNVPYADLSDFFYVWLRRSLRSIQPGLFSTLSTPKTEELVAFAYRHSSKAEAEAFFLKGMTNAMRNLRSGAHPAFPVSIFYAFKQSENDEGVGDASTGWETFLAAVIEAGFVVTGTWPVRTEGDNRQRGIGANALASSIVLVCRVRPNEAQSITRRQFIVELNTELPSALRLLQGGNIAPVDLAQAAIGPGMAVYTRYAKVVDAEGNSVPVREALALINQVLDETLAEQEGDFDADSRFALAWFEQYGFTEGEFGVADVLARAKVTAVDGLVQAGIIKSGRGKVRLLKPEELAADWDPSKDDRLTAWETVHQLIRTLAANGESATAALVAKLGSKAEAAREIAYRLYALSERKKRAADALAYNGLVQSWPEIIRLAAEKDPSVPTQGALFGGQES